MKFGMTTQGRVPTTLAGGRGQGSGSRYGGSRGVGHMMVYRYRKNDKVLGSSGVDGGIQTKLGMHKQGGKCTKLVSERGGVVV